MVNDFSIREASEFVALQVGFSHLSGIYKVHTSTVSRYTLSFSMTT